MAKSYHGHSKEFFRHACRERLSDWHHLSDFMMPKADEDARGLDGEVSSLAREFKAQGKTAQLLFDALIDDERGHFDEWLLLWMANSEEVKDWGN